MNIKDIEIKNIDHLGIVAGIIDSIGLVKIINDLIGQEAGEKVSAGHVVKAMILNGLGMVSQPLYMFPKFFENIACEHLIGSGVLAEYLNDDKLGRVMDKLFIKGLDGIFLTISLAVVKLFGISLKTSHLDSSSFHFVRWLSRVPLTLTQAKELVSSLSESEFNKSKIDGYSYIEKEVIYAEVKQRWLIVQSQLGRKSDLRKLSQNIEKSLKNSEAKLKTLSQEKFICPDDATKELSKISQQFKYHQVEKIKILEKKPSTKDKKQDKYYQILATVTKNQNAIDIATRSAGRFIIATNVLESSQLSNDEMISEYKAQQSCERGFGFLKDPLFFADSIFLKSQERIEALAMIMGLCLLVYTLAQRQIRAALEASNSTIKNQLGKSINNPTLRWIFQCFQSIHLVTYNQEIEISNLTPERNFILSFLPETCRRYYNYVT